MVWVVVPLDEIKIDEAFVLGLGADADPADVAIVRAVIAMAHALRCEVVAEGVESMETWTFLWELGCDLAQGYYLSCPLPATALEQWARTASWGCAYMMRQLSLRHARSFAALRMTCEAVAGPSEAREILRCAQDDRRVCRLGPHRPGRSFAALRMTEVTAAEAF